MCSKWIFVVLFLTADYQGSYCQFTPISTSSWVGVRKWFGFFTRFGNSWESIVMSVTTEYDEDHILYSAPNLGFFCWCCRWQCSYLKLSGLYILRPSCTIQDLFANDYLPATDHFCRLASYNSLTRMPLNPESCEWFSIPDGTSSVYNKYIYFTVSRWNSCSKSPFVLLDFT